MIPKYLREIQTRLAALPDGAWSYDDGITDDRSTPVEQGKPAALYVGLTWVADLDTEMLPREQKDACGRFLAHAKEDIATLLNDVLDDEAALDAILASCESVGFMREVDVPDNDREDHAPIRTSRPTATVVAEMAAEVIRLRALVETKQAANLVLVAELGGDVVRLARLQTYLETVAKSGPLAAGDLAAGLHPTDRNLMGNAVEAFLLAYAEAADE